MGIDISEKMLNVAREMTAIEIQYLQMPIEDISFLANSFDVVISSLTFHYIASFSNICAKIYECLAIGGAFVFSVEHPIFTANANQQWCVDNNNNRLHWPIDNYFDEVKQKQISWKWKFWNIIGHLLLILILWLNVVLK